MAKTETKTMPVLLGGDLPTCGMRVRTPDKWHGEILWTQAPCDRYSTWTSVVSPDGGGVARRYRTAQLRPAKD